jgi:hypothetical protein
MAGWIMSQLIFPFGVIMLVVLQIKNLFKPRYKKHAGYILWALGLALVWTAPLGALDRAGQPVFPPFGQLADQSFGVVPEEKKEEPKVAEVQDTEVLTTEPKPEAEVSDLTEPAPAETAAATPTTVAPEPETAAPPDETAGTPVVETEPAPAPADVKPDQQVKAGPAPAEQPVSPEEAAAPAVEETPAPTAQPAADVPVKHPITREEAEQLRQRIAALETEVAGLKEKAGKQDRLIQDLFIWLADQFREDAKEKTRRPMSDITPMMGMPSSMPKAAAPSDQPKDQPDQPDQPTDQPKDLPGPATDQPDQSDPTKGQPAPSTDQPDDRPDQPADQPDQPPDEPDRPSDQSELKDAA